MSEYDVQAVSFLTPLLTPVASICPLCQSIAFSQMIDANTHALECTNCHLRGPSADSEHEALCQWHKIGPSIVGMHWKTLRALVVCYALEASGGNNAMAAILIGMSERNFYRLKESEEVRQILADIQQAKQIHGLKGYDAYVPPTLTLTSPNKHSKERSKKRSKKR